MILKLTKLTHIQRCRRRGYRIDGLDQANREVFTQKSVKNKKSAPRKGTHRKSVSLYCCNTISFQISGNEEKEKTPFTKYFPLIQDYSIVLRDYSIIFHKICQYEFQNWKYIFLVKNIHILRVYHTYPL